MIGDSAGLITPLCGNGMSMALHASKLAFNAIDLYLKNKLTRRGMEELYINEWQKQFQQRLLTGRIVQQVFGGNKSTALFLKTMHAIPTLSRLIIKSTHGQPF
jgi:flavin-dependent dehydrogenase